MKYLESSAEPIRRFCISLSIYKWGFYFFPPFSLLFSENINRNDTTNKKKKKSFCRTKNYGQKRSANFIAIYFHFSLIHFFFIFKESRCEYITKSALKFVEHCAWSDLLFTWQKEVNHWQRGTGVPNKENPSLLNLGKMAKLQIENWFCSR